MFNTTVHETKVMPHYAQTVHEHRAPTDKSIEIMRDMEQKAFDAVIKRVKIESNEIKFEYSIHRNGGSFHEHLFIRVNINGEELNRKIEMRGIRGDTQKFFEDVRKNISEMIADHITVELLQSASREIYSRKHGHPA